MKQYISLHLGGCGVNIGFSMWDLLNSEHKLIDNDFDSSICQDNESIHSMYSESHNGKYVPRCIFADADCFSLSSLSAKRKINKNNIAAANVIHEMGDGSNGTAMNVMLDYTFDVNEVTRNVQEAIRHEAEKCDSLGGFILTYSMEGGFGSGMSTILAEQRVDVITDSKTPMLFFPIISPIGYSNSIVSPYNSIFNSAAILEHFNASAVLMDNQALYDYCTHQYISNLDYIDEEYQIGKDNVNYRNVNHIVAQVISNLTSPMRFTNNDVFDKGYKTMFDLNYLGNHATNYTRQTLANAPFLACSFAKYQSNDADILLCNNNNSYNTEKLNNTNNTCNNNNNNNNCINIVGDQLYKSFDYCNMLNSDMKQHMLARKDASIPNDTNKISSNNALKHNLISCYQSIKINANNNSNNRIRQNCLQKTEMYAINQYLIGKYNNDAATIDNRRSIIATNTNFFKDYSFFNSTTIRNSNSNSNNNNNKNNTTGFISFDPSFFPDRYNNYSYNINQPSKKYNNNNSTNNTITTKNNNNNNNNNRNNGNTVTVCNLIHHSSIINYFKRILKDKDTMVSKYSHCHQTVPYKSARGQLHCDSEAVNSSLREYNELLDLINNHKDDNDNDNEVD